MRRAAGAIVLCLSGCDRPQNPSNTNSNQAPAASSAPAPVADATPQANIHFTDITRATGIDFISTCGKLPAAEILEVNGGGLALIDYDNDGDLDLFIANGATLDDPEHGPGCRMYENLGGMKFRDVTAALGIDVQRWAMGVAVGDFDGDRFDDLFLACYGPDILLRNESGKRFADVTSSAGLAEDRWSTGAAFADLDNDADLDLYVCNYLEFDVNRRPPRAKYKGIDVMAGPHGLKPQHDILWRNNGDGTFTDITEPSGCKTPPPSFGLNALIIDFDQDGWQDVYVANDSMPGFLFRNLGVREGLPRFEEIGQISGIASSIDGGNQAAMGIAVGDVDANELPDKFITVFSSDTNTLHLNIDGKFFEDRSQQYGLGLISRPYLGWASAFYDFDHDRDEDLVMFNGHVYPEATMQAMDSEFEQPPLLFARESKRFKKVEAATAGDWLAEAHRDRAAVFGDLDADGDIDMIVNELNGPIRVLRNDAMENSVGAWLIVELRDERPQSKNHRALGSRIELESAAGKQTRWIFSGGSFQASIAQYVHFGLADAAGAVALNITWPDGHTQRLDGVTPNQHLIVRRH